jgi:hypothetical protein
VDFVVLSLNDLTVEGIGKSRTVFESLHGISDTLSQETFTYKKNVVKYSDLVQNHFYIYFDMATESDELEAIDNVLTGITS